jgi:hypothetical protein
MAKSNNRKDIDESYSDYVDDASADNLTEITDMNDTSMSSGDLSSTKTASKTKMQQDRQMTQQAKRGNQNDR